MKEKLQILDLDDIFKHLRKRPYLFLSTGNFMRDLPIFFMGLRMGLLAKANGGDIDFKKLEEFSIFINNKFDKEEFQHAWITIQRNFSNLENHEQLNQLLKYWDEFNVLST